MSSSVSVPHTGIPGWTLLPFAAYLLLVAIMPLVHGHFWEKNRNKLVVAVIVSLPVVAFLMGTHPEGGHLLLKSGEEYLAFMALLTALFVISGGIFLHGSPAGTPIVNTVFLAIGAILANLIGTTGASVLLIRPFLRANRTRMRTTHIVVFFIFIVSNGAGLLTPLGDPPLFLGFLRGVPFSWTFRLWPAWVLLMAALLIIFNVMDQIIFNREEMERPGSQLEEAQAAKRPLSIDGGLNLVWLGCVVLVLAGTGTMGSRLFSSQAVQNLVQVGVLVALTVLSLKTTAQSVRTENGFSWGPILEVGAVFSGIFVTMIPAVGYLEANGASLGVTKPWQFFWATGVLSIFLDNAPTYLSFASLAVGVVNQTTGSALAADRLVGLAEHPLGSTFLAAISCGAVMMGAMSYIGNGPNFMVKAIAERHGVRMPGFFGYMGWSTVILLPVLAITALIFF